MESRNAAQRCPRQAKEALENKVKGVCLDCGCYDATIDALPLDKETTFVCLDTALDDSQKVNLAMQSLLKVI